MKMLILATDAARLQALRRAAAPGGEMEVTEKLGGAEALVGLANGSVPDVLIVDSPTSKTIDCIEAMARHRPSMRAIAISPDPSPEFLLSAMRAGVREVLPTADLSGSALRDALSRVRALATEPHAPKRNGRLLAFIGCKGGVGATFLASNLAYAIASESRQRVALVDLNLRFGDAAMYVSDQKAPSNVAELARQIHRLDGALLDRAMLEVLPNFGVLAAPDDPTHFADVKREHVETIINLARSRYDIVVVDAGRSLDAAGVCALDMADAILCVMQMGLPFVRNARRLLEVFHSLEYQPEKTCLVVNRLAKSGDLTLEDVKKALRRDVEFTVPNHYSAVSNAINLGVPLLKAQRGNPVAKALIEMSQRLAPDSDAGAVAAPGLLSRVFGARN